MHVFRLTSQLSPCPPTGAWGRASDTMPPASGQAIESALVSILCFGRPVYDTGYVGWGTPGLFSMLNSLADELLVHVYRGERPRDVAQYYAGTKLLGYGNVSLATHFAPWSCSAASPIGEDPHAWAVPLLLAAPRYAVASRLVHIMYRRADGVVTTRARDGARYALAVHIRRGDKLTEARNAERIQIWTEEQIVAAAAPLVAASLGTAVASKGAGEVAQVKAAVDTAAGRRPAILVASDDNAFATRVESRLRAALGVIVERPPNEHDHGTAAPFDACDASCIPPLQSLAASFSRASALMLSTKSNMGSFMLTYWGAANGDVGPPLVDMDGKVHKGQLARGKHFCALNWGSRHGMCDSNRTTVFASSTAGGASTASSARPHRAASSGKAVGGRTAGARQHRSQ